MTTAELFAEHAARTPDATALRFLGAELCYRQLDERAENLARRLRAEGVGPETVVGVCVRRSFEMVVALLGVLKADAAYLPLDLDEPAVRRRLVFEQADVRVVVARVAIPLPGVNVLTVDGEPVDTTPPPVRGSADSLAYVRYTSGSTGHPKGVAVPHRGVVRLVHDTDWLHFGPDETFLQLCALTFDPSEFEIWGALCNGGCLVIHPPGPLSLPELAESLRRERITTLWLTSGLFHRMVDHHLDSLGGLRQLVAGGDVLSPAHVNRVRRAHPRVRMVNAYGPTENTCFTTSHTVTRQVTGTVPIGTPLPGTRVYVLDENLRPVPEGELYTGGAGLARGYLNRPGWTDERFVPDPFVPGERMYRTGDVVRRGAGGMLEFLGRVDDQVKIAGHRVEPGEVAAALTDLPGVAEAVVLARNGVLVAYVVPAHVTENLSTELRAALRLRLPRHLVPTAIVLLAEFPLTSAGKIDRAALSAPRPEPSDVDVTRDPPRTPVEATLARLLADTLAVPHVGVHDDFFDIGGNSLLAVDILDRARRELSIDLPVATLFFENPTVAGLAEHIAENEGEPR
ncbi:non-ribosomal peptide synthetase [Actinophytocola oryzae]|uniref:Amino acid adenylation domain-containing protein n=1 Tax=Actinophytocola oryzae TaxID=502181 RepID=A0A4V3FUT7_9PSEU|nr:non-ribosomal peptide synthetase [Actinophytocola oryzae]TDV56471.1 amino acid adenylation domain-containing protein [Actinophytocola oryzae]